MMPMRREQQPCRQRAKLPIDHIGERWSELNTFNQLCTLSHYDFESHLKPYLWCKFNTRRYRLHWLNIINIEVGTYEYKFKRRSWSGVGQMILLIRLIRPYFLIWDGKICSICCFSSQSAIRTYQSPSLIILFWRDLHIFFKLPKT